MFSPLRPATARLGAAACAFLLACGLVSCSGGGGGAASTPAPTPAVAVSFAAAPLQVLPGQSAALAVAIQRSGGFTGPVRLSAEGLPAGVSVAVSPAGDIQGASATLTFAATPAAAATTTTVLVKAVATAGSPSASAALTLQVLPPPQGFQVGVAAATLLVARPAPGETAARSTAPIPLTLTRSGGYAGSPTWTVESLPGGVTAAFQPAATGEPASFTLAVSTAASPGTSQVRVQATDGALASSTTVTVTVSGGNDFEYRPEVLEIKEGVATVLAVSADSVTLQGSVPAVQPGKVLFHNAAGDTRFLRKVASVASSGGNTVLATTEATPQDVFARAAILKNEVLPGTVLAGIQGVDSSVTFGTPVPIHLPGRGVIQHSIPCKIDGFKIKDDGGNVLAELHGEIYIVLGIEAYYVTNWNGTPQTARVAPYLNVAGYVELSGRVNAEFNYEAPLTFPFKFPTPFNVGGLGVNGELALALHVNGSLDGQGRVNVAGFLNAKSGVEYAFGTFSAVNEWSHDLKITAAEVRAGCSLGVSLLRPSLGLDVLGMGQVYVDSDLIRAELDIAYQSGPPAGFRVSTFGDFNLGIGGRLKLGPLTIWQDRFDLDLPHWPYGTPTFLPELTPAATRVALLGTDSKKLWIMAGDGSGGAIAYTDTATLYAPSLSPDGNAIVFGRMNPSTGKGELCTVGVDGLGFSIRTGSSYSINHPAWGPGNIILFDSSDGAGAKQIYALNLVGNGVTPLTSGPDSHRHPAWSPDGNAVAFEHRSNNSGRSRIARFDYSNPAAVTFLSDDATDYYDPCFSANGRRLVFRDGAFIHITDDRGNPVTSFGTPFGSFYKHPCFSPDGTQIMLDNNPVSTPFLIRFTAAGTFMDQPAWGTFPSWREIR